MSLGLEGIQFESFEEPEKSQELDFIPYVDEDEEKPSKLRSLFSAAPKGFLKEVRQQMMKTPILGKGLKKIQEDSPELVKSDEDVQQLLSQYLPTQEGFAEAALERGGEILPYALVGGGNLAAQAIRSALAGFSGQAVKEAGGPEWLQAVAEIPAFAAPGLGKKIIPTSGQKETVEGARKLGLSEEQITPLIQSETKKKLLAKISPRRGRTQRVLEKSQKGLGEVYDRLESGKLAQNILPEEQTINVIDSIDNVLEKLPAGVRKQVEQDYLDLVSKPMSGSSLINFWKDLNHYIGKGEKQLGILKGPLTDALEKVSPELAQDFRLTNKLYGNFADISKRMKPSLVSDLYSAGDAVRLLTGISLGNYPILVELGGEKGGRILAREMLLNPRLQNLGEKMMSALNQNKISAATQFKDSLIKEIETIDPEIAEKLKDVDFTYLE